MDIRYSTLGGVVKTTTWAIGQLVGYFYVSSERMRWLLLYRLRHFAEPQACTWLDPVEVSGPVFATSMSLPVYYNTRSCGLRWGMGKGKSKRLSEHGKDFPDACCRLWPKN